MKIFHRFTGLILLHLPHPASLADADLTSTDLTDANLTGANLMDANLTGANLMGADLTDANLTGANLMGANLMDAKLTSANLMDANLTGANLMDANLMDANLTGANLMDANLTGADLMDANLTDIQSDLRLILLSAINEVPVLLEKLKVGEINGSIYEGDCSCLCGTIATTKTVDDRHIPGLTPDQKRPAERWFLAIRPGDTPEKSQITAIAVIWVEKFLQNQNTEVSN